MRRGQKASAEQIVLKLRQIEVQTAQGKSVAVACKEWVAKTGPKIKTIAPGSPWEDAPAKASTANCRMNA